MANFRGSYDYSVDAKGRVNIPAKFRKALSPQADETFIIVRAPGNCLRAYPKDVWDVYESNLAARPETPEILRLKRLLFSSLSDSVLDVQGRVMLTPAQMAMAGISRSVTLVGGASYIEIWDTERYQQYLGGADDFDDAFFKSVETGLVGR